MHYDINYDIIVQVGQLDDDLKKLEATKNIKFLELLNITTKYFGQPRIKGSHHIFKTPWKGKPWLNLQKDGKMAKVYQVKQVMSALVLLKEKKDG